MSKKNIPSGDLSSSLIETISSDEINGLGKDILEVGIDSILKDGLLKDLPVINFATTFWKTGIAIRDHRFLTKLLFFLNESSRLSTKKRSNLIAKLEDEEYQKEAGEKLIAIIDNLETKSKAILLGKALNLFGNEIINKEEFWRISFIIEKLPLNDIYYVSNWNKIDLNKVDHIRKHLYMSVGLGWYVLNTSSTGFVWTERLCTIIAAHLLIKTQ